jgi:hypothetical protein
LPHRARGCRNGDASRAIDSAKPSSHHGSIRDQRWWTWGEGKPPTRMRRAGRVRARDQTQESEGNGGDQWRHSTDYESGYETNWANLKIRPERIEEAHEKAQRLLHGKARRPSLVERARCERPARVWSGPEPCRPSRVERGPDRKAQGSETFTRFGGLRATRAVARPSKGKRAGRPEIAGMPTRRGYRRRSLDPGREAAARAGWRACLGLGLAERLESDPEAWKPKGQKSTRNTLTLGSGSNDVAIRPISMVLRRPRRTETWVHIEIWRGRRC